MEVDGPPNASPTPEPPSVVAARQLAEEAQKRRPHARRSRPLKLQPLRPRPGPAGTGAAG